MPPALVLAADQRITWWARQLQAAGLDGNMDHLRARASLDLLLDQDSRPAASRGHTPADTSSDHPAGPYRAPGSGGAIPVGFAGRNHLTVPLATLLGLADRPGELPGLGPVDPWLARDLARASAANPKTTWCLTVTDTQGRATAHGCARPEPRTRSPAGPAGPTPARVHRHAPPAPGRPADTGPGGSPPGCPGRRAWLIAVDPIPAGPCDHRYQAKGRGPRGQSSPAPGRGPARHVHRAYVPGPFGPCRLRAQHPLTGRAHVLV